MSDAIHPGADWQAVREYSDITYHQAEGIARIAFNRPEVRNAFRPQTIDQMIEAFRHAWMDTGVGTVLLTGNGPSPKDGVWAFCAGGDQRVRGKGGYEGGYELPRLHVLELQRIIRFMPKVVIAVVPGWAVGGGHSLHVVCDLTLASREHARFQQADARVASFDGGYGSAYLAQMIGQKRARELFFLEKVYTAEEAERMGMVNKAVPHAELEREAVEWARIINSKSPTSIRMLKYAFNLIDDGLVGQQLFAGEATRLAYLTDEAQEGRDAFLEKRPPRFDRFPRWP
ncbi:MAG: 1,4-dihydroxy-2-naphthoyl-CoA synthase [Caldilineales bacterium]|nr:1,4-dihydroxy-2-naphthoyl-CoA synthase [Caldilineales bacterium]MDW8318935.1 1,4-dihydroxy-2-naphthoyl-CoA synthase [Anaerolineae bacterium]